MLAAPLSETYGRRIVYLFSVPIASAFTLGAGFSPNIETLCILRFFAGLVFSPALAIGAGSIADVTTPENRALANAIYILTPFLGPALGYYFSHLQYYKSVSLTQHTGRSSAPSSQPAKTGAGNNSLLSSSASTPSSRPLSPKKPTRRPSSPAVPSVEVSLPLHHLSPLRLRASSSCSQSHSFDHFIC